VQGSPFDAGRSPAGIAIDPGGTSAYVANFHSNNVSAYSINASGGLTQLTRSPFKAGKSPTDMTIR